jgi:hypothetical protein
VDTLTTIVFFGLIALAALAYLVRNVYLIFTEPSNEQEHESVAPKINPTVAKSATKTVTAKSKPEATREAAVLSESPKSEAARPAEEKPLKVVEGLKMEPIRAQGPREEDAERIEYVQSILSKHFKDLRIPKGTGADGDGSKTSGIHSVD